MAIETINMDDYIGFWDAKKKKRLPSLLPNKSTMVKVKASAYEGGYTWMPQWDLHKKLSGKRTLTYAQYKKLAKEFRRK